ncbi:MAG: hypothetical protein HY331_11935 [Chloroflexi bacterium]|nr:hypothetical protein [Chloroflexota bacterium]
MSRPVEPPRGLLEGIVQEAIGPERCPVCALVQWQTRRFLWHLLWESVNDVGTRAALSASRGFCAAHAWQIVNVERADWGSGLGIAIIYEDLVQVLKAAVDRSVRQHGVRTGGHRYLSSARLLDGLSPTGVCPTCRHAAHGTATYAVTIARLCRYRGFEARYTASAGLCFNHLQIALEVADDRIGRQTLLLDAQRRIRRLPSGDLAAVGAWFTGAPLIAGLTAGPAPLPPSVACPLCLRRPAWQAHLLSSLQDVPTETTANADDPVLPLWCDTHLRWLSEDVGVPADVREQVAWALQRALGAGLDRLAEASRRELDDGALLPRWRRRVADWALHQYAELAPDRARRFRAERQAITRHLAIAACPACRHFAQEERSAVQDVALVWSAASARGMIDAPICLPHLLRVLAALPQGRVPDRPMAAWRTQLEQLAWGLREYIRKHDYRYRDEPRGDEQTSWLRAVALVAGVDPAVRSIHQVPETEPTE